MQQPTLRLTITFSLVSMVLIATSLIAWFSYRNASDNLLEISQKLMHQVAQGVEQKTASYLDLLSHSILGLQASNRAGLLAGDDLVAIEKLYFNLMVSYPQLAALDFSDQQGNFLMVKRMADGSLDTKRMQRSGMRVASIWRDRAPGAAFEQIQASRSDPADRYDPRTRPWFIGAMKQADIHWSDVHAYYPNKQPEITASVSLPGPDGQRDRVVGASVTLLELSDFLARLDLAPGARIFVTDGQGRLIAFPDIGDWLEVSGEAILLPSLDQLDIPELQALAADPAYRQALASGHANRSLQLAVGEETWLGTLDSLSDRLQRDWFIGILLPESVLLGRIKEDTQKTLTLILLVLVAAQLLAMLVGRSITRPLATIAEETSRIHNLDFSEGPSRASLFREINDIFRAYADLRIGLRAFGKYVPTHLVRQLLAQRQEVKLGGELRRMTLFFSDIRSFSTTAESMPAADLAPWLGHYLGVMAETIRGNGGSVDKFIGDGVMAFWNAPQTDDDHAYHAVLAAFACLEAINRLSDAERLYTRIGIHTGDVVVGNFGSPDRFNYTVIGDGANLAARLEGVNKVYGTQILISQATYDQVEGRIPCRRLDRIAVKGKAEATDIYQPLGTKPLSASLQVTVAAYEQALDHYLAGNFAAARTGFADLLGNQPDDVATQVMLARTEALIAEPPGSAWSGVYELHSK